MFPAISRQILKICKEDFSRAEILAVALYGSRAGGYARIDSDYDILLVINNYLSEIRYHNPIFGETYLSILAVDRDLLEFDAEVGGLGDFVSGRLTSPYIPLQNEEYLKKIELIVKRRFIEEDLVDLILEYGILAKQLIIKPEYLAIARMRKRSRLYPPLRYSYYNMLREELKNKNLNNILEGYNDVLKNLEDEGFVQKVNENILLTDQYVDTNLSSRTLKQVINVVQLGQKTLNSYLAHGLTGLSSYNTIMKELTSKIMRELQSGTEEKELEDPKNYLFLKTSKGFVPLSERASIIEAAMRFKETNQITIKPLGGILNEVYLVEADNEKIVAKKFTDWFGFKWFTLNLVALGSKQFTVAGKEKLTKEYRMHLILSEN
jgi:predicted nucleotidyltransferase